MTDRRFFKPEGPFTLGALAELTGGQIATGADRVIKDVAPLDEAGTEQISFLDNRAYLPLLTKTGAGAVIVNQSHAGQVPGSAVSLICEDPYRAYAQVARAFYPEARPTGLTDRRAAIDPGAQIGTDCQIDTGVVIGAGAEIGDRCRIAANTVIENNVVIGDDCVIGSSVSLAYCLIGSRVTIHAGVRIGQPGFGFARGPEGHLKVPQVGRVVIHDDVDIGANTTIDRGSGPDTIIGPGCMIDNLVQIGHNVQLGRGCVIVAQVGISGSVKLEDFVVLGGQVGVAGHLTIGSQAMVAAKSGVTKSLPAGQVYGGIPAMPIQQWRRQIGIIGMMVKKRMANKTDTPATTE